jgi:hypothetical protein
MKSGSGPSRRERFYVLDAKSRHVELFGRAEWSRWMTENELIFRCTLLDKAGVTVMARFRCVLEPEPGEVSLFVTCVVGMEACPWYAAKACGPAFIRSARQALPRRCQPVDYRAERKYIADLIQMT